MLSSSLWAFIRFHFNSRLSTGMGQNDFFSGLINYQVFSIHASYSCYLLIDLSNAWFMSFYTC
ncbi:hypothetical protein Syun_030479 [Stephania yunnanensis]|uniref:Uncharacterized protein n=1 Tax=Stephania yunnanensis TaxID=152371 RepID=A0AAP0E9V4_9MAGN